MQQMELHNKAHQNTLKTHIREIAGAIGARPATSIEEERAFAYIREALAKAGVTEGRTLRFPASSNGLRSLWFPLLLATALNLPTPPSNEKRGGVGWRLARLGGAMAALGAGKVAFDTLRGQPPRITGKKGQSTTQIGIIPATGETRERLVLVANVDSPQNSPARHIPISDATLGTALLAAPLLHAIAGISAALFGKGTTPKIRQGTWLGMLLAGIITLAEAQQSHTPGANDNASGIAALLAAAEQLAAEPLAHTEVWVVFAGAGEAGAGGIHALLDSFRQDLIGAHFLNVTRVGVGRLLLVDRYTGRSHLTGYLPSPRTLAVAEATRQAYPVLGVERGTLADADIVATLSARGYHGATLTGYDPVTRLPLGWHAPDDVTERIYIPGLERAVNFILGMAAELDTRADD